MEPVQIYTIVNNMAEQSLGMTDLTATDTSFISIGKKVLSSDKNMDAMYKTLVDRIGRTVLAVREYQGMQPSMVREPFEYGAILQKISFKMPLAQTNPTWTPQNEAHSDPFAKAQIEFMQTFFDKWSTFEYPGTIYDHQLSTAFTNAMAMAAFIDGIFLQMQNALNIATENLGNLARGSLIAATMQQGTNTTTKVNLIADYFEDTGTQITVKEAFHNVDFLKYASMRMALASDQIVKPSTTFNIAKWQRHTPKDKQVIEIQANFAKAFDSYLQSDTYHNELTKLPNYESVPYWQGSGTRWALADVTGINLTIEVADSAGSITTQTVTAPYIVGVLRDIDSVGITIDKRRTKSIYNPHDEYTNYWLKADMGQYRDNSENCVVFYLADAEQAQVNLSLDNFAPVDGE